MRYESTHGATRKLTPAQKLAEMACERLAARENRSLPLRFWETRDWGAAFRKQLRFANALLKVYPEEVIFRAFHDTPNLWSLGAPFFHDDLKKIHQKYQADLRRADGSAPIPTEDTLVTPRPGVQRGTSVRTLLDLIDGKKKDDR
jgi:hypothetical protein